MDEPLSDDIERTCEVLGARVAASLGDKLGVPYQEGKRRYAAVLRRDVVLMTQADETPQLSPQRRQQIASHLADARALIDAINDAASPLPPEVQDRLTQLAIPLACGLADMVAEADRLEADLHTALARPWKVWGHRLFNDLVDTIERADWEADRKANAILSILTLKGVTAVEQSGELRRAVERVRQMERGQTDVWAALKAAPKLAIVRAEPDAGFTVELWHDGTLQMTAPVDAEALRHFQAELRQDHWDVRLEWDVNGLPTPANYLAEQEVAAHG